MAMVDVVSFLADYRRAYGSSPSAWSNGQQPSGAVLHLNLLWTYYGENGVMDFGLNRAYRYLTLSCNASAHSEHAKMLLPVIHGVRHSRSMVISILRSTPQLSSARKQINV